MKKLFFLLLILSAPQAKAQDEGNENIGSWFMYSGTNKLSDTYSLHMEAQLRLYEPFNNFSQLLLRIGLN